MKDFLEGQKDTQIRKDTIAQLHKTTESQKHNCTNTQGTLMQKHKYAPVQNHNYTSTHNSKEPNQDTGPEEVERIHVQIRKDLADKLFGQIYALKREGKKATQRHIIEQALEQYFAN